MVKHVYINIFIRVNSRKWPLHIECGYFLILNQNTPIIYEQWRKIKISVLRFINNQTTISKIHWFVVRQIVLPQNKCIGTHSFLVSFNLWLHFTSSKKTHLNIYPFCNILFSTLCSDISLVVSSVCYYFFTRIFH